jgi:hypothetical protein
MREVDNVPQVHFKKGKAVIDTKTGEILERDFPVATTDAAALDAIIGSEIDKQISTARRFPRSVTKFHAEAIGLVSLNENVADECIYALPRDDKTIEGPSARFAEVLLYSWGNARGGARVVSEEGEFVTAQGFFWDLEKNTAIGYEVKRRIVNKRGQRFNADMIGVTANAACSIALRNVILKGIPKALWTGVYEKAREVVMGNFQTLTARRDVVLQNFQKFGVTAQQVVAKLGINGPDDITLEHIVTLRGFLNALRDGDATVEEQFPRDPAAATTSRSAGEAMRQSMTGGEASQGPAATQSVQASGDAKASPGMKERGTPRKFKAYADKLRACTDRDTLGLIYSETSLFDWSDQEANDLDLAYQAQCDAIAKK